MTKHTILATALAAAFIAPAGAFAADEAALAEIRAELRQIRQLYEARIEALEKRLRLADATADRAARPEPVTHPAPVAAAASGQAPAPATGFNPDIALVLGGSYARLSQDPSRYRIQGFLPGGEEVGPGARGFSLGESELTVTANIDPRFSGQMTVALGADDSIGVEEAFIRTSALGNGVNLKAGRFLSSIGYLNEQHRHVWDFVDAPLAYQAFFGGQYRADGLQIRWLAPTERYFEVGLEASNGANFPGTDRNKNGVGALALFARLSDDLGVSASWRTGLSYVGTRAAERGYGDIDASATAVTNAFTGRSRTWVADAVYKWAPDGNPTRQNIKVQGEYFRRNERGSLTYDVDGQSLGPNTDSYAATQSGWYLQGVVQFMPQWRVGLRYDRLESGKINIGLVDNGALSPADFSQLIAHKPARSTLMFDYSPSEFSRLRLQFARDQARPGAADKQVFLQYIMSLGAHKAHAF